MKERKKHTNSDDPFKDLEAWPRAAMELIYARYGGALYKFLGQYTMDDDLIEDAIQETFFTVWQKRAEVVKKEKPYFWMQRVARNTLWGYLRAKAYRREDLVDEEQYFPGVDKTDADLMRREIEQQIIRAAAHLPETQRRVFMDSRFGELSHEELMQRHSLARQTVKNYLSKGIKFIREHLKHLLSLFI